MSAARRASLAAMPLVLLAMLGMVPVCLAQDNSQRVVAQVIDEYVNQGLESNLALRSQTLELERATAALDAARANYFPQLDFLARYTWAEGGRQIVVPLADALNPVYTTLNELLTADGRPAGLPQIEDRGFNLIREREQDTRVSLRQPLFAPAIPAAVRASRDLLGARRYARAAFARRLQRDISVAYLDWLAAARTVGIVRSSLALLEENFRVNESLFRNGKITQDQVLRAKAELLAVTQQLREAENGGSQAQSYLNFLLNRPLDDSLEISEPATTLAAARADLVQMRATALARRPELAQLERLEDASSAQIRIARAARWPTLALGVDAGIQGEAYEFGSGRNFVTLSLLINWSLFDGGARAANERQAVVGFRQTQLQSEQTARQIELEVQQALDRLLTANDSLTTAEARVAAADAAFLIASRKRDAGAISQVEFIDARASLAAAQLNLNVTRFALLARQADLDFATATGELPVAFAQ